MQLSRRRPIIDGLRDYGLPPVLWPEVSLAPMPGLPPMLVLPQECCLGLEKDIWSYVGHMVLVFREVWRVLREDGTLWLNLGDSYASSGEKQTGRNDENRPTPGGRGGSFNGGLKAKLSINTGLKSKDLMGIPFRVALALQADGWYLRSDVIWHKPNPMPESVTDRPTKAHEYVFLMSKSERYFYDVEAIKEEAENAGKVVSLGEKSFSKGQANGARVNPSGNGNMDTYTVSNGRNRRTVWTVATQPYAAAHFATFPPKLIEPMILASTSEYGVCGACGGPWVRVIEREHVGDNLGKRSDNPRAGIRGSGLARPPQTVARKEFLGWRPSCACDVPTVPAVVLDPFGGSGTTGKVALANRRNFILIDANPTYAEELAPERLNGTQIKLV
jgi:DNA modification methylase